MSRVPTGRLAPSMVAIFRASRRAMVTPRVRRPTKARLPAPALRSRISWEMRVRARSRAASSRTCAFSRRRGAGLVMISPCEPRGARLKERRNVPRITLHVDVSVCQPLRMLGNRRWPVREQVQKLIEVDGLGQVGFEPRFSGVLDVLGLPIAGEGDEPDVGEIAIAADLPGHLETVDVGQPDVTQDDLGQGMAGQLDARLTGG